MTLSARNRGMCWGMFAVICDAPTPFSGSLGNSTAFATRMNNDLPIHSSR